MPFLAEHLWRVLRSEDQPESVFLVRWPEAGERDEELLAEVAETRRVVELGRQARATSGLKLRQPLRRLVVEGAPLAEKHADEIRDELRVKEVEFGAGRGDRAAREAEPARARAEARQGARRRARPRSRPASSRSCPAAGSGSRGTSSGRTRCSSSSIGKEGWAVAGGDGRHGRARHRARRRSSSVEGRVLDLIHELNSMRKQAGLELTDRIVVTLPESAVRPARARGLDQGGGARRRDPHRRRLRRARDREGMKRCDWVPEADPDYVAYHDEEWGVPSRDDRHLFEMLTLEGAQAGLSWSTILRKREGYRKAFAGFDAEKVARFTKKDVERLLRDPGIVRNRLKVESTVNNAKWVLELESLQRLPLELRRRRAAREPRGGRSTRSPPRPRSRRR